MSILCSSCLTVCEESASLMLLVSCLCSHVTLCFPSYVPRCSLPILFFTTSFNLFYSRSYKNHERRNDKERFKFDFCVKKSTNRNKEDRCVFLERYYLNIFGMMYVGNKKKKHRANIASVTSTPIVCLLVCLPLFVDASRYCIPNFVQNFHKIFLNKITFRAQNYISGKFWIFCFCRLFAVSRFRGGRFFFLDIVDLCVIRSIFAQ
jgi:hypothetical protein